MTPGWRAIAAGALLAGLSTGMLAAPAPSERRVPSAEPVVRIATDMHTALIRRLVRDERGDRLITASDDKTIRIWRARDARLLKTLRIPIDHGHEGQILALAVSPDGQHVAAGGWTCWDWERAGCVYVLDTHSGELIKRVRGFPDAIGALAWSRDGRHLAVGLQGRGGLRILRTDSFAQVAADREYADKVMELDYGPNGQLAAVSLDGRLRTYRPDHRLNGRINVANGQALAVVRYARDGERLAVGSLDAAAVSLFDTRTLQPVAVQRVEADAAQRNLSNLAWSVDGELLYAAGERAGEGPNSLYRWSARGHGPMERFDMPAQRVSDLQALADGGVAYAAEDPRIGIITSSGRLLAHREAELTDFSSAGLVFKASADGSSVEFTAADGTQRVFTSTHVTGRAQGPGAEPGTERRGTLLQSEAWQIARDERHRSVRINGREPRLDDYEGVRCHALSPQGDAVVIGTEWALRSLDRDARERWSVKLAAVVRAVLVTRDGRWVIAALSDGTIRWYRLHDGAEALAYFPHVNGEDWVAWTPGGYYMSSPRGDSLLGWHVNRGADQSPDFYLAVQFERLLYRPQVVTQALRAGTPLAAGVAAAEGRLDQARLAEMAPPRLSLRVLGITTGPDGSVRARIRATAEKRAHALRDLTVYVNDIPVTPASQRSVGWTETDRLTREFELPLAAADNEIRIESFAGASMGMADALVSVDAPAARSSPTGDLYILAIGNNRFPHLPPSASLEFAARDAEALAAALSTRGQGLFRRIHAEVLSDDRHRQADRQSVMAALALTQRARAEDTVVIFLASHGMSDRSGNYWFVPRDATAADLKAVESSDADRPEAYDSLLSWSVFFDALRSTAGRRLLIVDTCQAKGMEGRFEPFSLMKRSAASRFSLMVASQANEESQEYPPARHGLFTFALLQALSTSDDTDRDGRISVGELFASAAPVVARLQDRALGTQTPALTAPASLSTSPLASASPISAAR
jgi:WD40 repeat protein